MRTSWSVLDLDELARAAYHISCVHSIALHKFAHAANAHRNTYITPLSIKCPNPQYSNEGMYELHLWHDAF